MNSIIVVTSVTVVDGKFTFHRQEITADFEAKTLVGSKANPVHYYIDQSREPVFSVNPGGGWVSPTFDKLEQMREAGVEPEDIDVVRCKCHKSPLESDLPFLEKTGHCESCVRRPKPAAHTFAPETAPTTLPAGHNGLPVGLPVSTLAVLESAPKASKNEIPEGGLDETSLGNLFSALSGSGAGGQDQMSLDEGVKAAFITKPYNPRVVHGQLWEDFQFTSCRNCGCWGRMGANRNCKECSRGG